jgi:hypothetical protein
MKTSVEINGYVISIEENDGIISVNAVKDEEVIEEFSIETEESQSQDDEEFGDDVQGFGEYAQEEDFDKEDLEDELEGQDDEEGDDDDDDDESEKEITGALESFQSFINKKK